MKKAIVILGLAALAATTTLTAQSSVAEAGGRHFRLGVGLGVGLGMAAMHHRHRHHHVHRAPVYETYRTTRTVRATPTKPASVVAFADAQGREYDPASKVWFDGKSACWTGKDKWTFTNGAWAYGKRRWYEAAGTWQSDVDGEPTPVDCSASKKFAAKIKTGPGDKSIAGSGSSFSEGRGNISESGESPKKTAVKDGAPAPECKKYFPSVGESISVPCT